MNKIKESQIFEIFKKKYSKIKEIRQTFSEEFGSNNFCIVKEIKYNNRISVAKLKRRKKNEQKCKDSLLWNLKNSNIVRIENIYTELVNNKYYDLIIQEKAILRDMGRLSHFYNKYNLLKLIYNPFVDSFGDNLLRFFAKQIINGLYMIHSNNIIHLNINPGNLLVNLGLNITITSLGNSIEYNEKEKDQKFIIPEAEKRYSSPEYYLNNRMSIEKAKKQDIFALGLTLFYFKFGEKLLDYSKNDESIIQYDTIINSLEKRINFIQSRSYLNTDFIDFICSLINRKAKNRLSLDKIIRNKWLNENRDYIDLMLSVLDYDEEKLIIELQKSDYLNKKEKKIKYSKINKYKFTKNIIKVK